MKKLLSIFCFMLSSVAVADVTTADIEAALRTVTNRTAFTHSYRVTNIKMDTPIGVFWNHTAGKCEVLVSSKNLGTLERMMGPHPKKHMLEGFIAHELSHCIELKSLADKGGYPEMQKLLQNPDNRFASELLSDIVAIMYWKRFYPKQSKGYASTLIIWRMAAHGDDTVHSTYLALNTALPLIPSRFDYLKAVSIRGIVLPQ